MDQFVLPRQMDSLLEEEREKARYSTHDKTSILLLSKSKNSTSAPAVIYHY